MFRRDDVVRRLQERPFRPFRVHTSAGGSHEVRHPELAMVAANFILIGFPSVNYAGGGDINDYIVIPLLHVTELEPVAGGPPPAPPSQEVPVAS